MPGLGQITLTVEVDEPLSHDKLTLYLRSPDGTLIAKHSFDSSYGKFQLDLIDLDGDRALEYVLIRGQGRGTSAREETLEVLSVTKGTFQLRLATPYSGYFGSGAKWSYEHEYIDPQGTGDLQIRMKLTHTPLGESHLEFPELIPADRVRVLSIRKEAVNPVE